MLKIKDGYKLKLQTPEIKLFGSTKKLIDKTKTGQNNLSLKVIEVVLVQCNLVHIQYQEKFEILYTFRPNKSYACLLNVGPSNLLLLKTYNPEFDDIIISFTDQNGRPLEIEGKISLTRYSTESGTSKYVKWCGFLSFVSNLSNKYRKILLDTGLKQG